jgi:hypothetical protein
MQCVCVCVYVCVRVCIIYIDTHAHARTHTHARTHAHRQIILKNKRPRVFAVKSHSSESFGGRVIFFGKSLRQCDLAR